MKLITFAVPCFNSAAYMSNCIDSLLAAGKDVEIIIINDGSTDSTGMIADRYQSAYPGIVRVIHKQNAGHGSGVNAGLAYASGVYFKVVDSDDYLDGQALLALMNSLRRMQQEKREIDLVITNFVYEHTADNTEYVSRFGKYFPDDRIFGWNRTKPMYLWHMLLMHALVFRTQLLKDARVHLPEHTFYVDNLFAYTPLPYVKKMRYLNINLYRYRIGRADQSVTVANMSARYEQQIRVMRHMLKAHRFEELELMNKPLRRQMYHFLYSVMTNTYFFTTQGNEAERKNNLQRMWDDLKQSDPGLYKKMRRTPSVMLLKPVPWKLKGMITLAGYRILVKFVKLG